MQKILLLFLMLFSLGIQAVPSNPLFILGQEKTTLLKKNLELKVKNTELKKLRDKFKKQKKTFMIATGVLTVTTAGTFIAGGIAKRKKTIAENKLNGLKDSSANQEEILNGFTAGAENTELIAILKTKCGEGGVPASISYTYVDGEIETTSTDPRVNLSSKNITNKKANGIIAYIKTNCSNINSLELRSNNINQFDISGLGNLEYLDLSGNQITLLSISNLSKLKFLDVEDNRLTSINSFSRLGKLKSLYISNNKLETIDVSGFNNLENLSIKNNNLTSISLPNSLVYLIATVVDDYYPKSVTDIINTWRIKSGKELRINDTTIHQTDLKPYS